MVVVDPENSGQIMESSAGGGKQTKSKNMAAKREEAAAIMLKAIDHVCQSWASTLSKEDLDQRAQSWYMRTRPDVDQGQAGWGQRGKVQMKDILALKKG
jgi:hypothetical protein